MTIKAIIWDNWGVLVNAKCGSLVTHWSQLLDAPVDSVIRVFSGPELLRWQADEINNDEFYDFVIDEIGLQADKKATLWNDSADNYEYDDKLLNYIKRLKTNYTIAMITNIDRHSFEVGQKEWPGFYEQFDPVIASCNVKMIKPNPRIYQLALEKIGCKEQEAVFIDDTEEFIQAAEKLGIHSILFKDREQAIAELESIIGS